MGQFTKSERAFARAQLLMPGGVNSPARAFGAVGGNPIYFSHGEGPFLYDVDGNRYVDYVSSWGPLILGHAHPAVVEAVKTAAARGTSFGAPTEAESELAELVVDAVPFVEKVRLVNSGTEATMSAVRLARGFTGRDLIVKFSGNYHGHVDSLLVAAGSAAATLAVPNSAGVTEGTARDTLVLPYNDIDAVRRIFAEHGERIAAVIVEPIAGNIGCVPPREGFLTTLREETQKSAALLIFDEVITGFRVAYGGAQQLYGVTPDLTTLGKIVGGGLPVGAYGGKAEIMDHVLPVGKVFQAGTLSGNPLATAAGIATIKQLRDDPPYKRLEELSQVLSDGLTSAAASAGVPHQIARVGSMLTLFFTSEPVVDGATSARCDTARYANFFWSLVNRGIYLPCSQFETFFVSASHTEREIHRTLDAVEDVFSELSKTASSS